MHQQSFRGGRLAESAPIRAMFVFETFEARRLLSAAPTATLLTDGESESVAPVLQTESQTAHQSSAERESETTPSAPTPQVTASAATESESEATSSPTPNEANSGSNKTSSGEDDQTASPGSSRSSNDATPTPPAIVGEDSADGAAGGSNPTASTASGETNRTQSPSSTSEPESPPATPPGDRPIALPASRASSGTTIQADSSNPEELSAIQDLAIIAAKGFDASRVISSMIDAETQGIIDHANSGLPRTPALFSNTAIVRSATAVAESLVMAVSNRVSHFLTAPSTLPSVAMQAAISSGNGMFHFARLGNPIILLDESVSGFIRDLQPSSRSTNPIRSARAWTITVAVVATDAAAMLYTRKRRRQSQL